MIRLLMAMSTLGRNPENEKVCGIVESVAGTANKDWKTKYFGQLEPTAFYLLEKGLQNGEGIEFILLCTKETKLAAGGAANTENDFLDDKYESGSAVDVFVSNINEKNKELNRSVRFKLIDLDVNNAKYGIEKVVNYLKDRTDKNSDRLWIDTHGGFRDIAFILNSIVSLLNVYEIEVEKIVSVQTDRGSEEALITDASESFAMLDFVSGMNEFINFGSAVGLLKYLQNQNTDVNIGEAISMISDGTSLCDPQLYIKGLDKLSDVIEAMPAKGTSGYLSFFIEYIKKDYGILLDKEKRTTLDIIKRCYERRLYQQALTFIEALMPEMFSEFKVLYRDATKDGEIDKIKEKMQKKYDNEIHYVFDQFVFTLSRFCITDQMNCKDENKLDRLAINAITSGTNLLNDTFFECHHVVIIKHRTDGEIGKIEMLTNVKDSHKSYAGKLLALHKAIKRVRNIINHAKANGPRPTPEDIKKGIKTYIELADKVFDNGIQNVSISVEAKGETEYLTKQNAPKSTNGNAGIQLPAGQQSGNKAKNSKANKEKTKDILTITGIGISKTKNKNKYLVGTLTNGSTGKVMFSHITNVDPESLVGTQMEVVADNEPQELYKPV